MRLNTIATVGLLAVLVVVSVLLTCSYIVDEREQVVVTRFNRPVRVIVGETENFAALKESILTSGRRQGEDGRESYANVSVHQGAGLYLKLPFIEQAERFPDTVLEYDAEPRDIITRDKKKMIVDNFARWRIENPLLFRVRVRNENNARQTLDNIIYSVMREELGKNNLIEVIRTTNEHVYQPDATTVTEAAAEDEPFDAEDIEARVSKTMRESIEQGREAIMKTVTEVSNETARSDYGINIIDVRIKRAELMPENMQAVFGRMQAERSRISKAYRSEGRKEAEIIKATTDKEVEILLAEAERQAQELRGEGDAESLRVFLEAVESEPEFYEFMKSIEVIESSTPEGSEFVLGVNSSLYRLLNETP